MCFTGAKKCLFFITFWINFMEYHSIQFTTISINVERGIVKILFKYRYFQDLLIDIDIDIDIFQNLLVDIDINIYQILLFDIDIDIDIFQNCLIDIDIDIFQTLLVDIDIFKNLLVDIDIDIFQICRYIDYRYKYSIFHRQIRGKKGQNRLKTGKNDRILHNYLK